MGVADLDYARCELCGLGFGKYYLEPGACACPPCVGCGESVDEEGTRCAECQHKHDNAEPGDEDGEAFRGGEAAAYQAEQQAYWQSLK